MTVFTDGKIHYCHSTYISGMIVSLCGLKISNGEIKSGSIQEQPTCLMCKAIIEDIKELDAKKHNK